MLVTLGVWSCHETHTPVYQLRTQNPYQHITWTIPTAYKCLPQIGYININLLCSQKAMAIMKSFFNHVTQRSCVKNWFATPSQNLVISLVSVQGQPFQPYWDGFCHHSGMHMEKGINDRTPCTCFQRFNKGSLKRYPLPRVEGVYNT